jgi:hypothetical protein
MCDFAPALVDSRAVHLDFDFSGCNGQRRIASLPASFVSMPGVAT